MLAVIRDRRRSQRGSVLSGVLIITAFIAIISGALMTELSANFLLSHNLVVTVANEASMNSALELAISQLQDTQTTPMIRGCPTPLSTANLNGRTVVSSYASCWPTIERSEPQIVPVGFTSAAFTVDGTHAQIGALNDYVVGNSAGTIFDYTFGATAPRWTLPLRGSVTAPPMVMRSPGSSNSYLDVVPLSGLDCSNPNNSYTYCLNVRVDNGSAYPPPRSCLLSTPSLIATQPAASPNASFPGVIYFADSSLLYAADVAGAVGGCDVESVATAPTGLPVAAGPIAFSSGRSDYLYAVVSDASSSRLIQCSYRSSSLSCGASLALPWGSAAGLSASSGTLPASVAITFKGGGVALVRLAANGAMSPPTSVSTGSAIAGAPSWCGQCGDVIGVAAKNVLYLYDGSLSLLGSAAVAGWGSSTSPAADGTGNWYLASSDGYLHELQLRPGGLKEVNAYGPLGRAGSSPQVGGCPINKQNGICVYLGSLNKAAYLVPLDARDAVISACISAAPPSCQAGPNSRLQAALEVGSSTSPRTVHVQSWSYYSG